MRVLITGHRGYIGVVMAAFFVRAGHQVTGLDTDFFAGCTFGDEPLAVPSLRLDIRDVTADHLRGFDAVVHLAALSNDPLGCLNEDSTYAINHRGSVRLAQAAKAAGVPRFLFASSCSLYGAAGDHMLDEGAAFAPVTAYGRSKVLVEADVAALADETFTPTYLRNATAYGFSPSLRADIVVNNFVGVAVTTGEIVMQSDGTPWRPLVHIEDISRAFLVVLESARERVHNQAFNVGSSAENYQIRDVAEIVRSVVPGVTIRYVDGAGPDPRCYRVDCSKIARVLPEFKTEWTVRRGVVELYEAFLRFGLTRELFAKHTRLTHIRQLMASGLLDESLCWRAPTDVVG